MWSEKHRPKRLSEMVGNEEARIVVALWLKKWKPGAKAMMLVGPPGTGKTTLVSLLARETNTNIVELNASDVRTKASLQKKIGESTKTVNLFGERSLIFLDEVDGLLGRSDYGGVEFIKDSLKETQNPVIMAANDPDSDEVKKLASSCVVVRFKPPPPREVELYLRRIAESERAPVTDSALQGYVMIAGGDLRQAINALQSHGEERSESRKDVSLGISTGLNEFLDADDSDRALEALKRTALQPMDKVREIQRCVVRSSLEPRKLAAALDVVSRADVVMGRIMTTQEWRLLRYLDSMLAQELHPILKGENVRYTQEDLPFPTLLRIWNDSKKIKEISGRYAPLSHTGARRSRAQDMPYVFSLCSDKHFRERLEKVLDLDETFDKFLQKEAKR